MLLKVITTDIQHQCYMNAFRAAAEQLSHNLGELIERAHAVPEEFAADLYTCLGKPSTPTAKSNEFYLTINRAHSIIRDLVRGFNKKHYSEDMFMCGTRAVILAAAFQGAFPTFFTGYRTFRTARGVERPGHIWVRVFAPVDGSNPFGKVECLEFDGFRRGGFPTREEQHIRDLVNPQTGQRLGYIEWSKFT